jgi:hypothetical protein
MLKKYMQYAVDVYAESEKSVLVAVPSYRILFGDSYTRVPGIGNYLPESMRANCIFENRKISYSYIEKRVREEKIIIFSVHGGKLLRAYSL